MSASEQNTMPPPGLWNAHGPIVHEQTIAGYPIRLYQHPTRKRGSFSVQYGLQMKYELDYADACMEIGIAVLHALACEGKLDNERP